jgi:esterase
MRKRAEVESATVNTMTAVKLNYQVCGTGQPLIVLHGLLGSSDNWRLISTTLGESFRVFALDQRNHGHSPHSPEMNYPLMAADLGVFMEEAHLVQAHVLGHSMGGKTAMQFALQFPDRVRKLIIVDIAPRAYSPHHQVILTALLALDPARYQTRKQVEEALAPAIPDLAVRQFLLKNLARDSYGRFFWRPGLSEINQNYPQLCAAISSDRPYEKPALFIRGERSDYLQGHDASTIQRLFPFARIRTIAGAGHLVHAENPADFIHVVLQFLENPEKPPREEQLEAGKKIRGE